MTRKSASSFLLAAAGAAVIGLFSTARPAAAHGFGYGYGPRVSVGFYGPPVPYVRPHRLVRVFVPFPYPHFIWRHADRGIPHVRPYRRFHRRYWNGY